MTAVSAYAPTGRNVFLRRISKHRSESVRLRRQTAYFSLLLLAIQLWKSPALRDRVRAWLRRASALLLRPRTTRRPLPLLLLQEDSSSEEDSGGQAIVVHHDISSSAQELFAGWVVGFLARMKHVLTSLSTAASRAAVMSENNPSSTICCKETYDPSTAATATATTRRIRENKRQIQFILQYWFGQFPPETSQKQLWMIASSSVERRDQVDQEITHQFEPILRELAASSGSGRWHEWCCRENADLYGFEGKVAAIVVLDQFSRHIRRWYQNNNRTTATTNIPPQTTLDELAYRTAQLLTQHHSKEIACGMVPLPMYVFSLMPYRHANTLTSVQYVQKCIEEAAGHHEQMDALLKRFRKATNRRLAILQDEARRTGAAVAGEGVHLSEKEFTKEDILEAFPFEADMSCARNHVVVKTMEDFLETRRICANSNDDDPDNVKPVIVSLSGGVDSMVIASVLAHLASKCSYNLYIVGIHIDYANRPESAAEADYVRGYCERLGILFQCRRIDEVTRGVTARDEYERVARDARYDMYRRVVQECQTLYPDAKVAVGVMLGHHRGDLRENVLSNAHKGCGPLDLSGMTSVSQNDGVTIYRPLLPLEKKEIYHYAHTYGVPYFKDTTPHWSTRGKLRNRLLPLLEEIYGEGSMNNLSTLATESDEARDFLLKAVLKPFLDQVERKPMGISFGTTNWKQHGLFFWKFVLREALHGAGLGMFSDKSVVAFLKRVQAESLKAGWLQCRKDYAVYLDQDGRVFVFYPNSFPFRPSDKFQCVGQAVPFGKENVTRIGPWCVYAEIVTHLDLPGEADSLLERKAVTSMRDLMSGFVKYYIKTPTASDAESAPRPLVFIADFKKENRPRAWKGGDLKIQTALPILGNDTEALKDLSHGSDWSLVRVTLIRDGAVIDQAS